MKVQYHFHFVQSSFAKLCQVKLNSRPYKKRLLTVMIPLIWFYSDLICLVGWQCSLRFSMIETMRPDGQVCEGGPENSHWSLCLYKASWSGCGKISQTASILIDCFLLLSCCFLLLSWCFLLLSWCFLLLFADVALCFLAVVLCFLFVSLLISCFFFKMNESILERKRYRQGARLSFNTRDIYLFRPLSYVRLRPPFGIYPVWSRLCWTESIEFFFWW